MIAGSERECDGTHRGGALVRDWPVAVAAACAVALGGPNDTGITMNRRRGRVF